MKSEYRTDSCRPFSVNGVSSLGVSVRVCVFYSFFRYFLMICNRFFKRFVEYLRHLMMVIMVQNLFANVITLASKITGIQL